MMYCNLLSAPIMSIISPAAAIVKFCTHCNMQKIPVKIVRARFVNLLTDANRNHQRGIMFTLS